MRPSRRSSASRTRPRAHAAFGLLVGGLVLGGMTASALAAATSNPPKPAPAAPATATTTNVKSAVNPAAPAVNPVAPNTAAAPVTKPAAPSTAAVPNGKPAAPNAAAPNAASPNGSVQSVTVKPNAEPPAGVAAKPPAVNRAGVAPATAKSAAPARAVPAVAGARGAAVRPVKMGTPAKPVAVAPLAHFDEHVSYQYNALGRRDPFQPLIGGEFVGDDVGGDAPVDVGGIKVVGIVWGASDKFALVEDGKGNSLVLRTGDKVMNGVVESLQRESLVVKLTVDGQTQSVAIPLTRKGDQSNATR